MLEHHLPQLDGVPTPEEVLNALRQHPGLMVEVLRMGISLTIGPWTQSGNSYARHLASWPKSGRTVAIQVALEENGRWTARMDKTTTHDTKELAMGWADSAAVRAGYILVGRPLFPPTGSIL